MNDPAIGGPDGDPDGDYVGNFVEYVTGTDPWFSNQEPSMVPGLTLDTITGLRHLSAAFPVQDVIEGAMVLPQVTDHLGTRWRADLVRLQGNGYRTDGRYEYLAIDKQPAEQSDHRFIRLLIAADGDEDGLPDDWEVAHGLNPNDAFDSMSDADGDGDSNVAEFLNATDAFDPDDNSNRNRRPRSPRNVHVVNNSDGTQDIVWDDVSDNEEFFVIYDTDSSGNRIDIGRVGPNETRFRIPPGH